MEMKKKVIAVLGGGNGAHMMAADMKLMGHEVRLYEMPQFKSNIQKLFDTKTIEVVGTLKGRAILDVVTDNIEEAVTDADYVLLVTPAFAHETYAKLLKGKLTKNQVVITFPGGFAGLVLKKEFEDDDNCPIFADTNNLPYDTRLEAPCKVNLFGRNGMNIGFMPADKGPDIIDQLREDLFPFERVYTDVLECGLGLMNPALHSGPCLLNISNIESPTVNFFLYETGFTPASAKLDIALDNERKAIGKAFGYHLRPFEDFAGLEENYSWQELYQVIHGAISLTPICGPNDINNRYLTEDAPFGLVPWSNLAEIAGVKTPMINAVVGVYSVVHETDWYEIGAGLESFGLEGMTVDEIKNYVKTGDK